MKKNYHYQDGILTFDDGHKIAIVSSNHPRILAMFAREARSMKEKTLLVLHHGEKEAWSANQEWAKEGGETAFNDSQTGVICNSCHQPVVAHFCTSPPAEFSNVRQYCHCTMIIMHPGALDWWMEFMSTETWNDIIVAGAKEAYHRARVA